MRPLQVLGLLCAIGGTMPFLLGPIVRFARDVADTVMGYLDDLDEGNRT